MFHSLRISQYVEEHELTYEDFCDILDNLKN